jgi:hypothetical protein
LDEDITEVKERGDIMKSRKRGFTRAELLVVIVIIAFAFSICAALVPSMDKAQDSAKRALCADGLRQIGQAVIMYANTFDNLLGVDRIGDQVDGHPYVLYRADKAPWNVLNPLTGRFVPLRFACLFETGIVTDPKLFYCPSSENYAYRYESYIDPPPWGRLPQENNYEPPRGHGTGNQWVRMGYNYYPTDPNGPMILDMTIGAIVPEETTTRFDRLDANIPYTTDKIWSRAALSHKSGIREVIDKGRLKTIFLDAGINALFKDGHVVYCTDPNVFQNRIWDLWDPPDGSGPRIDYRAFYYTIFKMIQP